MGTQHHQSGAEFPRPRGDGRRGAPGQDLPGHLGQAMAVGKRPARCREPLAGGGFQVVAGRLAQQAAQAGPGEFVIDMQQVQGTTPRARQQCGAFHGEAGHGGEIGGGEDGAGHGELLSTV
ncbi:MAG: hypothetical protein MUC79_16380 [Thiobacillaceae bacterium]|nr:hypothetical protein [Thiobacillaceae bacterium]